MNATSRRLVAVAAATALAAPLLLSASSASAHNRPDPARDATKLARKLVKEASGKDAYKHLKKFQDIADSAGGHRAAGSLGHDASAAYVYSLLKKAGYDVSYDTFVFTNIETQVETLKVVSPAPRDSAITAMSYTKSTPKGGITAQLAVVPVDATTGCEATDYAAGAFTGKIALIQRGGCDFALKQQTAAAAGRSPPSSRTTSRARSRGPWATRRLPGSPPAASPRPRAPGSPRTPRRAPSRSTWTCASSRSSAPPATSSPRPRAATRPTP